MKKAFLMVVLIITLLGGINVLANEYDEFAPVWLMSNKEAAEEWRVTGAEVDTEGGFYRISPTTRDPMMIVNLNPEKQFYAQDFPYFAYRHSTDSLVDDGALFYTTDLLTKITDASYSAFRITHDGSWSNVIINLGDTQIYKKGNWKGTVTSIRLDPINDNDTNATILIDRMGFFRTRADAENFLNAASGEYDYTARTAFLGEKQKAIIPGGTLYIGYKKDDFMLNSIGSSGNNDGIVVTYTSQDGVYETVALSYTNSAGYTTFVASRPGKYTLEHSGKEYIDTEGHWGKEYIDFVSARALFSGTSPNEFSPDLPMTRGMFITVLGRMHGIDISLYDGNAGFSDVLKNEYYSPYIKWATENGIIKKAEDGSFYPDKPILRKEMADVIYSYIKAFEYETVGYNDEIEFSDVPDEYREKIRYIQNLGVINGKGEGIFDPDGESTRAEVAAVMERAIKAVLGVNMAQTSYDNDYFSRERIRIGAWGFTENWSTEYGLDLLRNLGVDLIVGGTATSGSQRDLLLNYADKHGIEIFMGDRSKWNDPVDVSAYYADHPSFCGHTFGDEPGSDSFAESGKLFEKYSRDLPGKIPYINLLPMYANAAQLKYGANVADIEYYDSDPDIYREYCKKWFEYHDVDYICTDIYPLDGRGGVENIKSWTTYKDYCESINQIATVARENNAEFWCCIQTWGWRASKRNPTENEYRWQCYTLLSYGCKAIMLWKVTGDNDTLYPSIFNTATMTPTQPLYNDCAAVMWEMRELSDIYVKYRNLGDMQYNLYSLNGLITVVLTLVLMLVISIAGCFVIKNIPILDGVLFGHINRIKNHKQ